MKVSVAYTVDLEKVPEELERLLLCKRTDLAQVNKSLDEIAHSLSGGQHSVAIQQMASLRSALVDLDFRLNDCMEILSGFLNQKNPPERPVVPEDPTGPPEPEPDAKINPSTRLESYRDQDPKKALAALGELRKANPDLFPTPRKKESK
tara:strand:+ start:261 stop:707 length:447 start_codon:yes stop_codon:yes gene_type:complete